MPEFLKKNLAQIQAQLNTLNASHKLLIGCVVVILCMTLFLVMIWSSESDMVELANYNIDTAKKATFLQALDDEGIQYKVVGNTIRVPQSKIRKALNHLVSIGVSPQITADAFDKYVKSQNGFASDKTNQTNYDIFLQQILGGVLKETNGIDSATVVISRPLQVGLGKTYERPSATVHVKTSGVQLNKARVEGIAAMVSGAVAEMDPQDVVVFDGNTMRKYTVADEEYLDASEYLVEKRKAELNIQEKIARSLKEINNLIVEVNAEVDLTRKTTQLETYDPDKSVSQVKRESSSETNTENTKDGGAPGVASNTGATIAGAGATGTTSTSSDTDTEYDTAIGSEKTITKDMPGKITQINAVVKVPRSYFVKLYKQMNQDTTDEPTEQDLEPIIAKRVIAIKSDVEPLTKAEQAGTVEVSMYYDFDMDQGAEAGTTAGFGMGSIVQNLQKHAVVGALVAASLFCCFLLLKRASSEPEMPNINELAGVPPNLPTEEELIGEASELSSPMTALELDEDQIANRQVLDQISEMIQENPDEVANVVERWIRSSD